MKRLLRDPNRGAGGRVSRIGEPQALVLWATVVVLVVSAACQVGIAGTSTPESTVEVMHWTSSHLFRDGLLPDMAVEFNEAGHKTRAGNRIVVHIHNVPSQLQGDYLISRVEDGQGLDLVEESTGYVLPGYGDPTIVTPSSAHWLVRVNFELKRRSHLRRLLRVERT